MGIVGAIAKPIARLTGDGSDENDKKFNAGQRQFMRGMIQTNIENSGMTQKLKEVSQGTQGFVPGTNNRFQFAPPGSNSVFSDANGNKVVPVLESIRQEIKLGNAQGAKM